MYVSKHTHTTMQTRSQTRNSMNVSNVGSTSTPYQIHTRASTRNQSPVSSPRQTPIVTFEIEEACFEDAEFAEYDSSSDYDPNESYSVDIDFDEAANAWRANKRSTGNGCFTYTKNAFQEPKKTTENTHSMRLRSRA